MSRPRPDMTVLAAGLGAVVLGTLLALDRGETISLSPGWIAAITCAVAGAVLVISALAEREG